MPVEFPKFWPIVFLPLALFYMLFLALNSSVWEGDTSSKTNSPPLTIHTNRGRLGNQMFLLATLLGLCLINGRNMTIMPYTVGQLAPHFDLKYPMVDSSSFVESNPWYVSHYLSERDRSIPGDANIVKGALYFMSFTFFGDFRREVTSLFTFKSHLLSYADDTLNHYRTKHPKSDTFIGVHVRRGDYLPSSEKRGWLEIFEAREVDIEYFQKAMAYFKQRYPSAVFLVVSEDRRWCKDNLESLGMIVTPDSPSPGHDMALLSKCNHTIMTYGTFGFWSAYLAGGETVYFSNFVKPDTYFARMCFQEDKLYLPDWVGISTTPAGYWSRMNKESG